MNASDLCQRTIGRAAVLLLAWAFAAATISIPAAAAEIRIQNTARVDFISVDGPHTLDSNTVVTDVASAPIPPGEASIELGRHAPGSAGSALLPVDGGQCRAPGGAFLPLPALRDAGGLPLPAAALQVVATPRYSIGEPIVVTIADPGRNADRAVREFVEVELTTTNTGDAETLRLQETGPDTGVFAGAIQGTALPPAAAANDCTLSLADGARITARYNDGRTPPETLTAEAIARSGAPTDIRLDQIASRDIVEIGDFIQYTLVVYNVGQSQATNVQIRNLLPQGLRYQAGSLRIGDPYRATAPESLLGRRPAGGAGATTMGAARRAVAPQSGPMEPTMQDGGRTMLFNVGDLEVGEAVKATFIVEVGAGVSSQRLVNYSIATADGAMASNETDTVVSVIESLNTLRFTIAGRVVEAASCGAPDAARKGVANVRILLEDGTYAATDEDGAYHFEGVRPGTHIAQVDTATLPGHLQPSACLRNTRHAGRDFSQFVEAQGGTLARADFVVVPRGGEDSSVGARLQVAEEGGVLHYTIDLDGGPVAVSNLTAMLALPQGAKPVPGTVRLDGKPVDDPQVTGTIAMLRLTDPGSGWRHRLELQATAPSTCADGGHPNKLVVLFDAGGASGRRIPPVEASVPCPPGPGIAADSGRTEIAFTAAVSTTAASPFVEQEKIRKAIPGAIAASGGGDVDWFAGQAPGHGIVFPAKGYNPRSPATRVVARHLPGETAQVLVNGEPPSVVNIDGTSKSADGSMAVTAWRGLPLRDGSNQIVVEIRDASGATVATLRQEVYYAGFAIRAELVPEQSILVADGLHKPVIAVRLLDRRGHPVRDGLVGEYAVGAPYLPARDLRRMQGQQAGMGAQAPAWRVEGDDGIAYIELEPSSTAGMVKLQFRFSDGVSGAKGHEVAQDIDAWLKSTPRDWVVVGFAKGSVGYDTLQDNMQALPEGEDGKGLRGDGQVSLYAKGRVLGKWLLTMAYDSDKDTERLRNQNLLSTIDPGQYYTLYGDGTQQGYDAASARKLYLKLERDQFYVLFGDFQSGMDRNELSRYQRTLNGMKVEYRGPLLEVAGFAARTSQSYIRNEIQGDGTSGLYRLKQRRIVMNSERIRIETRDRYHSEQVLASREMARHIDYDIDYDNGTLFFREPIASRDFEFNPNWIVAEYETQGTGEEFLNAGTRVGMHALQGRLEAGASYIRDETAQARSQLAGMDAKFRLTATDELRAEAASTRSESGAGDSSGNAWLVEWEHRGEQLNLLAYARRQSPGFGLGQQGRYESGMAKTGVQGQYKLGARFALQGEAYRQEDLARGAVRDVAKVEANYRGDDWTARTGVQLARDEGANGKVAESRQVTLGATRTFLDRRLELGVQGDFGVAGKNQSVDFPARLQLSAAYRINEAFRVLAAQEFTDGKDRDTATTRVGFEAKPWKDATVTSTFNQSQVSEYGPRTFALFGLNQKFVANEHWSFDVALDSSQAFNESGNAPLVVDPSQPIQAGGIRDGGALTEDFVALSGGATYRTELWMWNARLEGRQGDDSERHGATTAFLRQIRGGVAMSASAQAFSQRNADGSTGILANAQLSWAYRPLGGNWSMLDKLEFRLDQLRSGTGESILGNATAAVFGDARSARIINNFALNYVSDAWQDKDDDDTAGDVLDLQQRSQVSLYYGSKYVIDSYDANDYKGYSDLLGIEWRYDLSARIDVGIRASVLHSWSQKTVAWAFGPQVGFSPFTNAWMSLGYNVRGFDDRDFDASHHTAKGAYLVFRLKFDQKTFGLDRAAAAAP